uniref:Uncharacterized protein n=1 Tax=Arundo donax TaxID=35708 RepID=A0A0A9G2F9_ARUDO
MCSPASLPIWAGTSGSPLSRGHSSPGSSRPTRISKLELTRRGQP